MIMRRLLDWYKVCGYLWRTGEKEYGIITKINII